MRAKDDEFTELDWEDLLDGIQGGDVIPVIGSDLLTIELDDSPVSLARVLAQNLAEELGIASNGDGPGSVFDVAADYLASGPSSGRQPSDLYRELYRVVEKLEVAPTPEPLRQLAEIEPFSLFVTTTVDSMMAKALQEVRRRPPTTVAYGPGARDGDLPDRLPGRLRAWNDTYVYHLFGKAGPNAEFAITEEDLLEYVHQLQRLASLPSNLMDALEAHQLLVLGCRFPDWLARFLIRMVKGKHRLSSSLGKEHLIVGGSVPGSEGLESFLRLFSDKTRIVDTIEGVEGTIGSVAFVAELNKRYRQRRSLTPSAAAVGDERRRFFRRQSDEVRYDATDREPPVGEGGTATEPIQPPTERPAGDPVFLSYERHDEATVHEVVQALKAKNVPVWFDRDKLEIGDDWEQKIMRNIRACSLFVPVISKHAANKDEGYVRTEWYYALKRMRRFTASPRPFIVPLVLDKTSLSDQGIPSEFGEANAAMSLDSFPDQVAEKLKEVRRRAAESR